LEEHRTGVGHESWVAGRGGLDATYLPKVFDFHPSGEQKIDELGMLPTQRSNVRRRLRVAVVPPSFGRELVPGCVNQHPAQLGDEGLTTEARIYGHGSHVPALSG